MNSYFATTVAPVRSMQPPFRNAASASSYWFSRSSSLSRARSATFSSGSGSVVGLPLACRFFFSQLRNVSAPTPYSVATTLMALDESMTSRHS